MTQAQQEHGRVARVVLYTAVYCGYCWQARSLLDELGIPYEVKDVTSDAAERRRLTQETGLRTVPNVFIDGKSIGGNDKLQAMARAGLLEHLRAGRGSGATLGA